MYTIPSKFIISIDHEHHWVEMNAYCAIIMWSILLWHIFYLYPDLLGPSSVTKHASDNQCLRCFDDTSIAAKLPRVRNQPHGGPNYMLASLLLQKNSGMWEYVNCELLLGISQFHCTYAKYVEFKISVTVLIRY